MVSNEGCVSTDNKRKTNEIGVRLDGRSKRKKKDHQMILRSSIEKEQQSSQSASTKDDGDKNTIEREKRREENERRRIRIATYNIHNGRQGNLESALRALQFMNVDLSILQETKISDYKYTRGSFGYEVLVSKADTVFQGSIELAYRTSRFWTVESIRIEEANAISFLLVTGKRQYTCLGA
jgi:hypothetical protein